MLPPVPPKRPGLSQIQAIKANSDYIGKVPDELSFQAGDLIFVIYQRDGRCRCKCNNQEGYLPLEILNEYCIMIENPVHDAARRGNLAVLKSLVTSGMSINTLDHAGNVPLYCAARAGHFDCVKILLAAKPVLEQQNKLGDTVLHGAAWGGHSQILKLLLQQPSVDTILMTTNKDGKTALQLAKNMECGALLQNAIQESSIIPADTMINSQSIDSLDDSDDE